MLKLSSGSCMLRLGLRLIIGSCMLRLRLRLSIGSCMLSLSLSMHEPLLSLSVLVLDPTRLGMLVWVIGH